MNATIAALLPPPNSTGGASPWPALTAQLSVTAVQLSSTCGAISPTLTVTVTVAVVDPAGLPLSVTVYVKVSVPTKPIAGV
jgi:hypothetical protein